MFVTESIGGASRTFSPREKVGMRGLHGEERDERRP